MMIRSILAAGALALGVTAAIAQANVIQQRQALMKQNGQATRAVGGMLRGQAPFDLAQTIVRGKIDLLVEGIHRVHGYDFSGYAAASLRRRLSHWLASSGHASSYICSS